MPKKLYEIDPGSESVGSGAGYVVVTTTPNHPGAKMKDHKKTYVYKHNVVMENSLGRNLRKKEHVHHKNENKKDNSPSNLELSTENEHPRHHALNGNPFWKKSPFNKPKKKHKKAMAYNVVAKFLEN